MSYYADLYEGRRSEGESQASRAVPTSALGRQLDKLVGGTLAAQEYRDRLDALTHNVQASDEKVLNLTRLVKLLQGIQEEKEVELRRQNDELRARLTRQEQLTEQLQQQIEALRSSAIVNIEQHIDERVEAYATVNTSQQQKQWVALQQRLEQMDSKLSSSNQKSEELFRQRLAEVEEKLLRGSKLDVDATSQWAKRNLVKLKNHVDTLRDDLDDIRGGQEELKVALQQANCRAEEEYKKVLVILQQKTVEADALTTLVEKELRHVHKVVQQHKILGTKDIAPVLNLDDRPYDSLKFCTPR